MKATLLLTHQPLGAQLLQAVSPCGHAIFYLSPHTAQPDSATDTPARGGVPVLFPQFADYGPLPKHGWVRRRRWVQQDNPDATPGQALHYALQLAPDEHPAWPHTCKLGLSVQAGADTLKMTLTVCNTGSESFQWTGGLHPYFAVNKLTDCQVLGLGGLGLQNRYNADHTTQALGALTFDPQPLERLFDSAPPLTLITRHHTLHLSACGFDQWMVWNPGQDGALSLADLPNDDWQRFLCVEPVCVTRPVTLAGGEQFVGQLLIRITPVNAV